MRRRTGQRAAAATLTVALALTSTPALAKGHRQPKESIEHALVHWVNVQRQQRGLAALAPAADLTSVAHQHTAEMAEGDHVFHDPTLGKKVHGYLSLGEDVGSAATLAALEKAFLADANNRANLVGPAYRQIGVGTKIRDGLLYVTILTRRPSTVAHH
jgi:uncharacterized protein YkwD